MGNNKNKCYECREQKVRCFPIFAAGNFIACQRCIQSHQACKSFGKSSGSTFFPMHNQQAVLVAISAIKALPSIVTNYGNNCLAELKQVERYDKKPRPRTFQGAERDIYGSCNMFNNAMTRSNIGTVLAEIVQLSRRAEFPTSGTTENNVLRSQTPLDLTDTASPIECTAHVIALSKVLDTVWHNYTGYNTQRALPYSPLLIAVRLNWTNAFLGLLEQYSWPQVCVDFLGRNIVHTLAEKDQLAILRELNGRYDLSDLVDVQDLLGYTPLSICAYKNHSSVFCYLLRLGANILQYGPHGQNILAIAVSAKSAKIVEKCLLEFGGPMEHGTVSPLEEAAKIGNPSIIHTLMDWKANPFNSNAPASANVKDAKIKRDLEAYEKEWSQTKSEMQQNDDVKRQVLGSFVSASNTVRTKPQPALVNGTVQHSCNAPRSTRATTSSRERAAPPTDG